jgi:hypothetical protein
LEAWHEVFRRRIDVNLVELDQVLDGALEAPLSEADHDKLKDTLHTLAAMLMRSRNTEKTSEVVEKPEDSIQPDNNAPSPPGHGRNRAESFGGARKVDIKHQKLTHGDRCPECGRGNVFEQKEPKVLVWRLDRWGRSVTDLLATLQELEHLGVGFVSPTEALDLPTPAGRAMAALLSVFAEFEREILGERVRAGLAHAQQNGKRLGRPATATMDAEAVCKLRRSGLSKSEIARQLHIDRTSVRCILDERT